MMRASSSPLQRQKPERLSPAEILRRTTARAKRTQLEELFAWHIRTWGLPKPEREYHFHSVKGWRFDFAWPPFMVAVEVEGGTWRQGRHTRGAGFEADAHKYAEAARLGWQVLRFTAKQVKSAYAVRTLEDVLSKRRPIADATENLGAARKEPIR